MVSFARKQVMLVCAASIAACSDAAAPPATQPLAAESQWTAVNNVVLDARTRLVPSLQRSVPALGERLTEVTAALVARNSATLERALAATDELLAGASGDAAEIDAVRIALSDARQLLTGAVK